jgi:YesN/AraC family two-component response regulator
MPAMNGFQLCGKIREQDPRVKIYFLSAFDIYAKEAEHVPNIRFQGIHEETDSV